MKINIIAFFLLTTFITVGCTHSHKDHENETENDHQHAEGNTEENEGNEEAHANEIFFTEKQAIAANLRVEEVTPSGFRTVIKTGGQIQATQGNEFTVVATQSGIVSFTNSSIVEGTSVNAGETIANISAKNLQDGEPAVKAKLALEAAEKEYLRAKSLAADKIISAKEFEQISLRYHTAKAAYSGQASSVTAKGAIIKSPIGGYIKNRLASQGDYVSLGQPIATVAKNKRLQLRAEVSESYFKTLRNVSSANFKTSDDNSIHNLSQLNGRLLSYGKASSDNSFYVPITFEFDNIGDFLPGSVVEVYLLSSEKQNVISIPLSALTEEQGFYFVYLKEAKDVYRKQEVKTGESNGERIEITGGLKKGDKVVVSGAYQVKLASVSAVIPHGHNH